MATRPWRYLNLFWRGGKIMKCGAPFNVPKARPQGGAIFLHFRFHPCVFELWGAELTLCFHWRPSDSGSDFHSVVGFSGYPSSEWGYVKLVWEIVKPVWKFAQAVRKSDNPY
jgi:hypothetical protein